jgi:glycosyltransferase involved in cell wall biosynthesis
MTAKISLSMIVKNEALNLRACLESVRPHVDEIVIVDTGSTDDTPAIAKDFADKFETYLDCNDPETGLIEDFSMPRNRALELATHEWLFWMDGDDVLVGGENLRRLAEESQEDNVHILAPYEYQHDEQGRCTVRHLRERLIFPRHRFVWQCPVHEGCLPIMPLEGGPLVAHVTDEFHLVHQDQQPKPRESGRNQRILEKYLGKVGEGDPRALYYLGLEYGLSGRVGDCMRTLRRYVELTTWREDERCLAMLDIARCFQALNDHEFAIEWALRALASKSWSSPNFTLARSFYELGMRGGPDAEYNFRRCAHWARRGIDANPTGATETVQTQNPLERFQIHEILNVAFSRIGELENAAASCRQGIAGLPGNEMLQGNLELYERELRKRTVLTALDEMVELGQLEPASRAIIRATLAGDIEVQLLGKPIEMPDAKVQTTEKRPGKLDLVIFVGHGFEPWTPETARKTGIGGSETMVMELGKRLAAMGHRVRVYGHCPPTQEGIYDGMEWYDGSRYHDIECDVLIASRRPDAVDDSYRVSAGARLLWVHDVHCGPVLDMPRSLRIDRILALSEWHKSFLLKCYPLIHADKILVTRNGIDLSRFDRKVERNPKRVIYSSSPDRGLENLLEMWPTIRERVPEAELRIFYGFENWETAARMANDENQLRKIRHLQSLCKSLPGVTFVGRVSQERLTEEFLGAGVWAYPTWFWETSCITAMEAQAADLCVLNSNLAGLTETAPGGIDSPIGWEDPVKATKDPAYREEFLREMFRCLAAPNRRGPDLERGARFSLDALADDWDRMLTEIHEQVTREVVPAFKLVEVTQ